MYIAIVVVVVLLVLLIIIYNTALSKKNKLLKAYSSLDVMLKKRYDLIPNIVETIKGYVKYESELLQKITSLRRENNSISDMINSNNDYESAMEQINLLAENYPELKASQNFIHLQKVLTETEEQISAARRTYNAHVEDFNTYISLFPFNVIVPIFGFKKFEFFEAPEAQKENINLKSEDFK